MPNTTHIFAIGGTGARVVKSLSFLLAAGYETSSDRIIRPVFLDPDKGNGDATRTHRALTLYHRIHEATNGEAPFFNAKVQQPFANERAGWSASLGVESGSNYFHEQINYEGLSEKMQDLTRMLFGKELLDTTLENGYLGNPNVGTVAMNAVKSQQWFVDFADNFSEGDDIILVASIFGGTGAAGLPLLVKTLRNATKNGLPNPERLEKARIGAVIVQPYFGVKTSGDSPIDHNTFVVKTKAALAHYARDIDAQIDVNYPVGDPVAAAAYENQKGGSGQENPAHLVEVVGALSIIDFLEGREKGFIPFGAKTYPSDMLFQHLGVKTEPKMQRALTNYTYALKHWRERIDISIANKLSWTMRMATGGTPLSSGYTSADPFFKDLQEFNLLFLMWLFELRTQSRSFFPLDYEADKDALHTMVRGVTQRKLGRVFKSNKWGYKEYDEMLNKVEENTDVGATPTRLLRLFHDATAALYQERIAQ